MSPTSERSGDENDPNEPEHRVSPSTAGESAETTDGEVSRGKTGSRHAQHPAPKTADERTDSESVPEPSDIPSVGADLQHPRRESKEGVEEPLDGELVSPEVVNQVVRQVISTWAGPTPSPETLQGFNNVDPSFAERAFKMSEETVAASNYERKVLADGDIASVRRGQWMAWSGSLAGMLGAITALLLGYEIVAAAF